MSTMKKQKMSKEEDVGHLTISSIDGLGVISGTVIPTDHIIETLSRLPAKSIARFRCVSKKWCSLLHNPYFTNMHLKKSSSRPRLLFTFYSEGKWSFFSLPQCLILDKNSPIVVVDNHMDVPRDYPFRVCKPVCGLLCTKDEWVLSRRKDSRMMIGNPSIGQFKSLPKVRSRKGKVITFFGYDPIEAQFKVLCMTVSERPFLYKAKEHQVLSLGTSNSKWRMVESSVDHYPRSRDTICINGVLYYSAMDYETKSEILVAFDVRYEKFNFIMTKAEMGLGCSSTLINYKGKLGEIRYPSIGFLDGRVESFELWVMDDSEEHNWSRYIHVLPPLWKDIVGETRVYIVGMIGTSEIVFSPFVVSNPFYIFHLDMEKNSITRVEIKGIKHLDKGQNIHTFINYVENVNLVM